MLTRVVKVQGMAEEAVEDEKISKVSRLSVCLSVGRSVCLSVCLPTYLCTIQYSTIHYN